MIKNYFTIAWRNLWRNKGYTTINVAGLSVAFCICVFLFLTAYLQLTFDAFHQDKDRIFQTYFFANNPDRITRTGNMPLPLAPALKSEYEEVEAATRVLTSRRSLITYQGKHFDKDVVFTDPDFLKIFSFPLIQGNRQNALNNNSSILISQSVAQAIFGTEDPIGKLLQITTEGKQKGYLVSGILADAPYNSSIRFDALVRIENSPHYLSNQTNWTANSHQVFVKLIPQVNQATFEKRLKLFTQKYLAEYLQSLQKKGAKPDSRGDIFTVRLQQLSQVHFDTAISNGPPIAIIYALLGMAFFILLIACINFINLSIARSFTRAKEVGVRKYLGALKSQLFVQIWSESALICFMGFAIGGILAHLLLPEFNATFDTRLQLAHLHQPGFLAWLLGIFILITFIAGGYPAWLMARFNAVAVLKGKISLKKPGFLRNSLLVSQFVMSCLLTCCTIIALQQVKHLRTKPLGFEKEQVISIPVGTLADGRQVLQRMRNKLANDPTILAVTGTSVNLGRGKDHVSSRSTMGLTYKGKEISSDMLLIDYDYLKTLQIPLLAGRDFNRSYPADSLDRVIITQSMVEMLGEKQPVGTFIKDDADTTGGKMQVIGVVPDFHLYSAAEEKRPIMMHFSQSEPINYLFVRVSPQSLKKAMNKLQEIWREVAPGSEFTGSFLDENIDAWYQSEEKLAQICSLASVIAIILSCSGLFAVALLLMEQRTKEIGIRKVLGASVTDILFILSRDFVKMVLIALTIAIPLAWFGMHQWLNNYTYRIEISAWVFVGVGSAAIILALLTVSFQSIKAALMNPVKSLKTE
ncbi:hypothetical protein AHMF7605_08315 [Adhaeribacter arboris]|uniref:ABC transporter permease n=2 Tax=Adhaeribacter arboris TaxID=2072846 RepID=A0A2T2YNZ1_9BACT|nr:hypothetical protein AHMF7605_08315 [Adhaeribacter arboris]